MCSSKRFFVLIFSVLITGTIQSQTAQLATTSNEISQKALNILKIWYPRVVDTTNGGYFNLLLRDGTPMHLSDQEYSMRDMPYAGLKDYNSSINLMEAYASLYKIWPDSLLRVRLTEIFMLIRDTFTGEKAGGHRLNP